MSVLYVIIVLFVAAALLWMPVFPFWKVSRRLSEVHRDIWDTKGPFDLPNMVLTPVLFKALLDVIAGVEADTSWRTRDPELAKWARVAGEVWRMMPRSFLGQVGCSVVFLYFTSVFTSILMGFFQ